MHHALCGLLFLRTRDTLARRSAKARKHGYGHVFVLGFMIGDGLFCFNSHEFHESRLRAVTPHSGVQAQFTVIGGLQKNWKVRGTEIRAINKK